MIEEHTKTEIMDIPSSLAVVALAALIHASFQLSVSVLTLLSSHTIGAKKSRAKLLRLTSSFVIGAASMSLLLIVLTAFVLLHLFGSQVSLHVWAIGCSIMLGIGIAVWLFYYRRKRDGTELWIPRSFAKHLTGRTKATSASVEAYSLGLTSVIAEIIFIVPSLVVAALVLIELPSEWQLIGVALYTVVSSLGLGLVWVLVGSGHSLSKVQKWREDNKRFLQFSAGSALVILGFFVYVTKVLAGTMGVV
jgi:hypothetical protein